MARILLKQTSVENLVGDLAALVAQDNLATSERGDLSLLSTFNKVDLVHAINEVNAEADTNRDSIDVINELIGSSDLTGTLEYETLTTDSSTIIAAINEVDLHADQSLKKDDNLASLSNVVQSRINLGVYSTTEVQDLINQAEINLGSNYSVDTNAERDNLEDLTIGDNVFVRNTGDGKWTIYKVVSLDGNDDPVFEPIMDEDIYLNSISKESVKAAYESNPDTNALTDERAQKIDYVSITSSIDLDKVIQNDELNTDGGLATVSDTDIPSSLAVKTYVNDYALAIDNNLSEFAGNTTKQEAAHDNLNIYSRDTIDAKIQNIEFIDPATGQVVNIGDMVQVVTDMEKAKKNYFFGLDILGALK